MESSFQKQQLQSRIVFSKMYFVSSRKGVLESTILAYGMITPKAKIAIQNSISEVHFVSFGMIVPKALFLLMDKIFCKTFPSRRVIL